jgi:hypothetical protein
VYLRSAHSAAMNTSMEHFYYSDLILARIVKWYNLHISMILSMFAISLLVVCDLYDN